MIGEEDLLQAGYRYALSLRPVVHEAEDLVQEAWLRLYGRGGRVRNKAEFFVAIRNLFIDGYRRERLIVFESLDEDVHPHPVEDAGDESLLLPAVEDCLARLRAAEREALFLHAVEGYSAAEIGALTGRARNTVLSLLHRAKLKLRRELSRARCDAGGMAAAGGAR